MTSLIKLLFVIFIISFSLSTDISKAAPPKKIAAIILNDWPVAYVAQENSQLPQGFAIDIMNRVAEIASLDIQYIVAQNWMEANVLGDKYETAIFPSMGITEKRKEIYDFTIPYVTQQVTIISRSNSQKFLSLDDLQEKIVGVVRTNIGVELAKNKNLQHVLEFDSINTLFMELLSGEVDAIIYPKEPFLNLARRAGLSDRIKFAETPIMEIKRAIAVKKGNSKIHSKLDKTLQQFLTTEEYKKIVEKWYSEPEPYLNVQRMLVIIVSAVGIMLLAVLFWRHKFLRRQNKILQETIIELRATQKQMTESKALLRSLIDAVPDLIWMKDLDGCYLGCNPPFEEFFGAKEAEIVGKTDYDYVDKEQADFFRTQDKNALHSDGINVNEETLTFAEDSYQGIFETIKCPLKEGTGKIIGVIGIARDITARKKTEEALIRSEERLKIAQRMGKIGNWEYTIEEQHFWGCDQAKQIYGLAAEKSSFSREDIEQYIPQRETVRKALDDLIEKGKPYDLEFAFHPNGDFRQQKWIRATAELEKDLDRNPIKVVGVVQDITNLKKAEEEKLKATKRLQQAQKLESLGNLAGGIAHDFNNILSVILGYTELAFGNIARNQPVKDELQEVYTAGKRARDLVQQILTFARQQDDKLQPIQTDIIVKEALKFLRSTLPSDVKIVENIKSSSLIMGNQTQIHQVVMNLCTNAAQAMASEGGILSVAMNNVPSQKVPQHEFSLAQADEYIELKISDTGEGIPPEIIANIFEPYFTTKGVGEGTGLGLSVVHGILENHRGQIAVESQLGKGTVFSIYLPILLKLQSSEAPSVEKLPQGSERILFVDDEVSITTMAGKMLESLGYEVVTRTSSVEALALITSKPDSFDVILTDMTMPNMTGDKLATKIHSINPDIPIILCTGYSTKMSEELAEKIGIKAYLHKPLLKVEFAQVIRKVLDDI